MADRITLVLVTALSFAAGHAASQDLVYQPVNPSFGGSPLNSGHLLSIANAQRNATASDYEAPRSSSSFSSASTGLSQAELFARQLQSRLLSSLSSEVVEAIFGDDPQESGKVVFGTTEITFDRGVDSIDLTLTDTVEGTVTEISVPQLVVN
ncbi:curli assembly protein CsgF [Donghicola eburneus]|jgi:curli production assembly/transport component CsgF|uniref:Curli production assembly/transport component CsgF n=1 Tax=Donghicola eburneus TaxID=393278 RepID=A0A1M4MZT5_9RHOB|nr:curli assembly protein CsgF [Donghicola eburneus]SCM68083.1 putative curli assembly protein CsgG [Donghicola eburneus]SFQ51944.1 curli production assembly/transport component CsgF [Donghicola eburneus]